MQINTKIGIPIYSKPLKLCTTFQGPAVLDKNARIGHFYNILLIRHSIYIFDDMEYNLDSFMQILFCQQNVKIKKIHMQPECLYFICISH